MYDSTYNGLTVSLSNIDISRDTYDDFVDVAFDKSYFDDYDYDFYYGGAITVYSESPVTVTTDSCTFTGI